MCEFFICIWNTSISFFGCFERQFDLCGLANVFMSHLADSSFILIQIFPELLELQVSFPKLLLQLPHHRLVTLHRGRRVATGPAVWQGLPAPTQRPRARALAGWGTSTVRVSVTMAPTSTWSVSTQACDGLQLAPGARPRAGALAGGQTVACAAVSGEAGEGVPPWIWHGAGLAAPRIATTTVGVAFPFRAGVAAPSVNFGAAGDVGYSEGQQEAEAGLALWQTGAHWPRWQVLHRVTILGNDGFKRRGADQHFLHVLKAQNYKNSISNWKIPSWAKRLIIEGWVIRWQVTPPGSDYFNLVQLIFMDFI